MNLWRGYCSSLLSHLLHHPPPKNHSSHHLTDSHTSPLKNSVPSQISRYSCVSGKSFAQNLQVRLSEGLLPFWFILTNAIHLDLYLKYTLQLDRDNLWRYCVSSGLRSTLSFDLLPSCIFIMHSSLILALIACLISFFVTSVAMTLGRPRDKQSVLDSVARPLILYIVS